MSKELFELYIDNLNESIKLINVIIPAIKKFEGKVYNRRMMNDINRAILKYYGNDKDKTVYFGWTIASDLIRAWFRFGNNRCLVDKNSGQCRYLPDGYEDVDLLNLAQDLTCTSDSKYVKYDKDWNKILNASLIAEALEEQKGVIQDNINNLKAHALKVDEYQQRFDTIQKELEELHAIIPQEIRAFFGYMEVIDEKD